LFLLLYPHWNSPDFIGLGVAVLILGLNSNMVTAPSLSTFLPLLLGSFNYLLKSFVVVVAAFQR
jgi:hypothetical protein